MDGVQTKGNDLTVIFTTNHENRINRALRRPGRIDLVLKFDNPTKDSVQKIYKSYLGELDPESSLDYKLLADYTMDAPGAVVAEIAKRAVKLCTKQNTCNEELVKAAVDSMAHHIALMNEPIESRKSGRMTIVLDGAQMNIRNANEDEAEILDEATVDLNS